MRYILCLIVAALCIEANASGCANGMCGIKQPVRTVTGNVVQATKNVTVGAVQTGTGVVRAVTPPYRCRNGRCRVR